MARSGGVVDPHRGARFQPLLVLGAVVAHLPIAIGHPDDRTLLLGMSGAFAGASVAAWWWGRRATSVVARGWVGLGLATATLAAYVAMLVRVDVGIVDLLPFGVLLLTASALAPASWLRAGLQTATVAVIAARLAQLGMPTPDLVVTVLLLTVVAGVLDLFAADLARARSAQHRARLSADRRSRLLTAVGRLLGHAPDRATRTTVDTLRGMGFDRVEVVTDLRTESVADLRTATVSELSPTAVPISVAGVPGGAIVVGHSDGRALNSEERDVVQVLAAQLGGAWEAEVRVARQQELLRRVTELERTRRGFLDAVSDELHAPLRSVREAVDALRSPSAVSDPRTRDTALAALVGQTDHLGTTITAVLDASSMAGSEGEHAGDRPSEQRIAPIAVADLLAPFAGRCELRDVAPDRLVLVSSELMCHAVDLWLTRSAVDGCATLLVDSDPEGLVLRVAPGLPRSSGGSPAAPARPLVARLVVAAGGRWRGGEAAVLPRAPVTPA